MGNLTRKWVIVAINALIVLMMALLFGVNISGGYPEPVFWVIVFVPPILAILAASLLHNPRARRVAYIVTAVLMLPAVFFGIWGAWGLLYAIAIVVLLMAARGEMTTM